MEWLTHLITFIAGLAGGSLLTLQIQKRMGARGKGNVVDQSGARAGGDVIGRDKRG